MKFCEKCDNMLYINMSNDQNDLIAVCRFCGHKGSMSENESICVINTQLKHGEQKFNLIINEYTKEDPTIPHIYSLRCPSSACKTNVENVEHPDVLYIRYDDENLKYLYMCVECNTVWKTNDK